MRTAIVSDIHGNIHAFRAVLADLREVSPDLIVHGGDLVSGGAHPAEILDEIRALGWPGVQGNTDEMLHTPSSIATFAATNPAIAPILTRVQDMIPPTVAALGDDRVWWLASMPKQHVDADFTLVHASPGDLWRAPIANASDEELRKVYAPLDAKVAVYAHIHKPFVRYLNGLLVANTGSVSQSHDGDTRASYLLVEGGVLTVRRVTYDVEAEARDLLVSGLPHGAWLARILRAGKFVPPDE